MKATQRPETNNYGISTASQMLRDRIIDKGMNYDDMEHIIVSITFLVDICHALATRSGWWSDPKTGKAIPRTKELFAVKIALCHSELSEALEGNRKGLRDDKLPHHMMDVVELCDTMIRALDTAGGFGYTLLGNAFAEKLLYNSNREDHKIEARNKPGGKAY